MGYWLMKLGVYSWSAGVSLFSYSRCNQALFHQDTCADEVPLWKGMGIGI
jgi:hypothetical protein